MLFTEAADGDARGHRIIAEEEHGGATDFAEGDISFDGRQRDFSGLGGLRLTDENRATRRGLICFLQNDLGALTRHPFAPIGERLGTVPFVGLGFGR